MKLSIEAERTVIGSVLQPGDAMNDPDVLKLKPEDFRNEDYRRIFAEALKRKADGEKMDPVEIYKRTGVNLKLMTDAVDLTPTANNAGAWARLLRDEARKENLKDAVNLAPPYASAADIIAALKDIMAGMEQESRGGYDCDAGLRNLIEWRQQINSGKAVVRTGYSNLDRMLGGGLMAGGMYVVGARPAMGKTVFALNLAKHMGGEGLIFSLEMRANQIVARFLAEESGLPSSLFLMRDDDSLSPDEKIKMGAATKAFLKRSYHIYDTVYSLREIQKTAEGFPDLRYVIIDYLGLLRMPGGGASRYEKMTELSGQIKRMAKKLDVPVIVLVQLNREVSGRSDHKPQLSDLRDTGAIEQDADAVLLLHREDYYAGNASDDVAPSDMQVFVAKNRYGRTGLCKFLFYAQSGRIYADAW